MPFRMNRRQFVGQFTMLTAATLLIPWPLGAGNGCDVAHPLSPPDPGLRGRCPNCGMGRSMWARTWKTFRLADRKYDACSFHCLADMALKSGEAPLEVKTALFLQPRGMVPAAAAWYVVGSAAAGTMTQTSKTAFAMRTAAVDFAQACGGGVRDYTATFALARRAVENENAAIDRRRLTTGKIVPPVDLKDECKVCRMFPSRYPRHRSQVRHADGRIDHFCSTHCLFVWLREFPRGTRRFKANAMIWVTDFDTGRWISGRTAYYVVASSFHGPMGAEAVAFDRRSGAREFVRAKGGRIRRFDQIETLSEG